MRRECSKKCNGTEADKRMQNNYPRKGFMLQWSIASGSGIWSIRSILTKGNVITVYAHNGVGKSTVFGRAFTLMGFLQKISSNQKISQNFFFHRYASVPSKNIEKFSYDPFQFYFCHSSMAQSLADMRQFSLWKHRKLTDSTDFQPNRPISYILTDKFHIRRVSLGIERH